MSRREWLGRTTWAAVAGSLALEGAGFRSSAWAGPEDEGVPSYRMTFESMGSWIEIRWIGGDADRRDVVGETARSCADAWVDVLSDYQQDSHCMQLCRDASDGKWVTVSDPLWRVILECDRWHRVSEGAFDAALGALTRLRRSSREVSENVWHEARARCGWEHMELDPGQQRIRLHRPGILLDFGAIGKGFVIDRIGESLRGLGISSFSINASGNLLCGEPIASDPPGREMVGWPIAIGVLGDPQRELKRLRLSQCGIATSGDQFQRFRDSGTPGCGPTSSHIVDPVPRRGLDQSNMATVIAARASDADALATACCVHMQRGSLASWLNRAQSELPRAEYVFQSWRNAGIAYTSIPCDW